MKTLNEEVRDIMVSNASKSQKAVALKKLCITPYEIEILLAEPVSRGRNTALTRYNFTFGVEIECGMDRSAFAHAAAQTGMPYEYQGYNHRDGHNFFKFVTDGSLTVTNAIECVSPVLKGTTGRNALKNACDTLNRARATVNTSCGLHVHIGVKGMTNAQYVNTFVNYMYLEDVIDSFMAPSRRGEGCYYAKTLKDHPGLTCCTSIEDVPRTLNYTRYHKVNPMSWRAHNTIEFRQHGGTTNYDKIFNWAQFCGKLVVWSKNNRLTQSVASIDEIPFLSAAEKKFFKERRDEFANRQGATRRTEALAGVL